MKKIDMISDVSFFAHENNNIIEFPVIHDQESLRKLHVIIELSSLIPLPEEKISIFIESVVK